MAILVLVPALAVFSLATKIHLAPVTRSIHCTEDGCANGTVFHRTPTYPNDNEPAIDWSLVTVGALTAVGLLSTWALAVCNWGTPWRLILLCLATLPIHYLLLRLGFLTYLPASTVDYDLIIISPRKPFALVCAGLAAFQGLLQLGFVVTQIIRWPLDRLRLTLAELR